MTSQAKIVVTAEDRASKVLADLRAQLATTSESARELSTAAGLAGPAFASLASAAGLVGFVKGIADAVDALNDVADATGASIESLSGLERVAKLNGGTLDDVSGILVKFNKALAETVDPASTAGRVFELLGLNAKELRAADPAEALQQTARALAGFADDGNKARITQELFGRSIKEAAPFLKDLAEAGELNGKVTTEQAAAAERFNKELFRLKTNAEDSARAIGNLLIPAVNDLFQKGREGGFAKALGLESLPNLVTQAVNAYRLIGLARERITPLSILEKDPGNSKALAELARIDGEAKKIAGTFAEARREYLGIGESQAGAGRGFINPPLALSSLNDLPAKTKALAETKFEVDKNAEALGKYIGKLYQEAEAEQAVTERLRALNALRSAGSAGELTQVRALVLALADAADAREQDAFFAKVSADASLREAQALQQLDAALDGFSGRAAEATRAAQLARLEARQAAGESFSDEELQKIVRGIYGVKAPLEKTLDESGRALEKFGRTVDNTLGDTLEQALRGNFSSIGRMWGDLLLKMAADALAADLSNALFGNLFKAPGAGVAGGGLGLIGDLLGAFGLGIGRASGGTVNPMSVQPVNERGLELFRSGGQDWLLAGPQGGKVVPNSALGGGGAVTVINNVTIGAGVSRNEVMAAMAVTQNRTLAAVSDERRRGSPRAMQ